jgi:outer membrane protein assembly factor BamB
VISKSSPSHRILGAAALVPALLFAFTTPTSGAAPTVTNDWETPTGSLNDSSPAVGNDGALYFGTRSGILWALNADGSRRWTFRAEREIKSSPALGSDGTAYFGSRDHKFYAVRPNGKKKWDFKTGGWVDSSPALGADGTAYFGSWDKTFYALRPDGSKAWQFPTAGPIVSSPAVSADGRIFFGSHDGKFFALTPGGTKAWEFATGAPIISSPAVDSDGTLYITSVNGWFYALNPDGTLKWRLKTGGTTESSPVIGQDGTLYVGVNQNVWLVSPAGQKKGEQLGDIMFEATPAALADGSLCFVSGYGWIITFISPGDWKWALYAFGSHSASPAVATSGTVYLGAYLPPHQPGMLALHASVPLAKSPWPKSRGNPQNTGRQNPSIQ